MLAAPRTASRRPPGPAHSGAIERQRTPARGIRSMGSWAAMLPPRCLSIDTAFSLSGRLSARLRSVNAAERRIACSRRRRCRPAGDRRSLRNSASRLDHRMNRFRTPDRGAATSRSQPWLAVVRCASMSPRLTPPGPRRTLARHAVDGCAADSVTVVRFCAGVLKPVVSKQARAL